MIKHFKRPLSIILAVLMVMSVFIAVPTTASAVTEDDVESLMDSMRVVIYGYIDQNDFDHAEALSNYYVPLNQAFEEANLQVTPEVESAYNAAYAYFYGGSGGQGGSGGFNGNYPNVNNVYMATDEVVEVTVSDLQSGDVLVKSSEPLEVQKGDCDIVLVGGTYGKGDVHEGILDQTYTDNVTLGNELHFDFMENARITDEDSHGRYVPVYNNALGNAYMVLGNDNGTVYLAGYNLTTYTITWKDYNGSNLYDGQSIVAAGTVPSYRWSVSRSSTAQYSYTFTGWTDSSNNFYSKDSDLPAVTQDETYTATYSQTLRSYTITWKDGDNKTLKSDSVAYGTTPSYTGATPTKTEDDDYTYEFNNTWSPSVASVTGNATYTAQFDATPKTPAADAFYVKVTTEPDDWSGDYLIVYEDEDGSTAFNGSSNELNSSGNYIDVTISGDEIASNAATDAAKVTIAQIDGGYSIATANGTYIGGVSGSNKLDYRDEAILNTISLEDDSAKIVSNTSTLRFNTSWSGFRYYKTVSQKPVQLYKLTGGSAPVQPPTVDGQVTWTQADMQGSGNGDFTKDGVTLTVDDNEPHVQDCIYDDGVNTFTAPGKTFSKIEIHCSYCSATPSGWTMEGEYGSGYTLTWTGNAESVTIQAFATNIESIVFTFAEPAPAPVKLILNVGENGKVVMDNGTFGNATDVSYIAEIPAPINVADGYKVSIVDGHTANLVEGGSINIATSGEASFYPSADNTGKITAIPDEGYICTGWYNGDTLYSSDAALSYQSISEDMTLTAKFAPAPAPEGINYGGDNYIEPDDTVAVSDSDEGKTKFGLGLDSYLNMQMLGIQKKSAIPTEGGDDGIRFVTAVNSNLLKGSNIADYGYIVVKAKEGTSVADIYSKMDNLTYDKVANSPKNIFSCYGSDNTISGDFGKFSTNTDYKYVTLSLTNTSGSTDTVAARFYVKTKDDKFCYADYIDGNDVTHGGMAFTLPIESNSLV